MSSQELLVKAEILQMRSTRILRFLLYWMGAWPVEAADEVYPFVLRWYRKQVPIQTFLCFAGGSYYIKVYFETLSFFNLSDLITSTSLACMTVPKTTLVVLKRYRDLFRDYFTKYHLLHYEQDDPFSKKITIFVNKMCLWLSYYEGIWSIVAIILYSFPPFYNNIRKGAFSLNRPENITLEFSVYIAFPGFDCHDHFYFTTIWNLLSTYNCSMTVCIFDLAMFSMVFHILGHIHILLHEVHELTGPEPDTKTNDYELHMYSYEENKIYHTKIVKIMNHHKLIVNFSDQVSQCFGIAIAAQMIFHLVIGCILLIMVLSGDLVAVSRFLPVTVINFGELITASVIYEVVVSKSEKLVDAVYLSPWERLDTGNRRILLLLLQRVQTPVRLTAARVLTVGVQTMLQIVKTNISYYMFFANFSNIG